MEKDDSNKNNEQQQLQNKVWDPSKKKIEGTWPGGGDFFLLWESDAGAYAFLINSQA